MAVSPRIEFRGGNAPCSHAWEHVHVEFHIAAATAALCENPNEDGMGVLALLTASVGPPRNAKPNRMGIAGDLGYVVPLPASCAVRTYELGTPQPQHFLQARINFGRLLEAFPRMVASTNPGMVVGEMTLKFFFVIDDE